MTPLVTVLVFIGIPIAVYAVLAGLIFGANARSSQRYRPGREFDFAPVWFLARPEHVSIAAASNAVAHAAEEAPKKALEGAAATPRTGHKGGASGTW